MKCGLLIGVIALAVCGAWGGTPLTFDPATIMRRAHATAQKASIPLEPPAPTNVYEGPFEITLSRPLLEKLDDTFVLTSNQCGVIVFKAKRSNVPPGFIDSFNPARVRFHLSIPKGFSFIDATCADITNRVIRAGANSTEVSFTPTKSHSPTLEGKTFGVMLVTDASPYTEGILRIAAEYGTQSSTNDYCVRLQARERLQAAPCPSFPLGIYPSSSVFYFPTEKANRAYAAFLKDIGVTWILPELTDDLRHQKLLPLWREKGIRYVTPDISPIISNGYCLSDIPPPSIAFTRNHPSKIGFGGKKAICPAALYEEAPFFKTNILPRLEAALKFCDGAWSNWEPYDFRRTGCFCARCRHHFAEFLHTNETALLCDWPWGLQAGARYFDAACRFRSREHGKVVHLLSQRISEITGQGADKVGFMPGICWSDISPGWDKRGYSCECRPCDYMESLKWLNPFGPYIQWDATSHTLPSEGASVRSFLVAQSLPNMLAAAFKTKPRLLAFPYGVIGEREITEPEWLRISLECFFFCGWQGAIPWRFPEGADARFWKAFTDANETFTRYEPLLKNATLRANLPFEITTPTHRALRLPSLQRHYLQTAQDAPLLQVLTFALPEGRILFVAFNFSDRQSLSLRITDAKIKKFLSVAPCRTRVWVFKGL